MSKQRVHLRWVAKNSKILLGFVLELEKASGWSDNSKFSFQHTSIVGLSQRESEILTSKLKVNNSSQLIKYYSTFSSTLKSEWRRTSKKFPPRQSRYSRSSIHLSGQSAVYWVYRKGNFFTIVRMDHWDLKRKKRREWKKSKAKQI